MSCSPAGAAGHKGEEMIATIPVHERKWDSTGQGITMV